MILGLIFGVATGVCIQMFVFESSSFSVADVTFVSAIVCGTLGMIFGKPVTKCFKAICRFWFYWW